MVLVLRSLVERAAMLTPETTLPASAPELTNDGASAVPAKAGNCDEQQTIVRVLGETKGRVGGANGAAALLGLKRTTLIARMKKLGIDAREVLDTNRYRDVSGLEPCVRSRGDSTTSRVLRPTSSPIGWL